MKDQQKQQRIVLTGGPGVGKTTLLEALEVRGYSVIPEAARVVIEQEMQNPNSECLPWKNIARFQQKVLETQLELEAQHTSGIAFLDRGIIDGHAYARLGGAQSPEGIIRLGRGRYNRVFLIDPLPTFQNDSCRKETPEEARKAHTAIHQAYLEFGYNPIRIPVLAPEERADYILEMMKGGAS